MCVCVCVCVWRGAWKVQVRIQGFLPALKTSEGRLSSGSPNVCERFFSFYLFFSQKVVRWSLKKIVCSLSRGSFLRSFM